MITLLMIGCAIGLIILAVLVVGIIFVMQSSERDTVSTAREDWIQRRSEKDKEDNS